MQKMAIQMVDVVKRFGQKEVLKRLNLYVPERSIFAFLGNNGEGKSTAIRVMLGLLQADQGHIHLLGRDITQERLSILQDVGCLVDAPSAYPNLSAQEFLQIACFLKSQPRKEIDRVLEIVGLRAYARQLIAQYSLGMKQRLALAHALIGSPRLLILDEPGNGLDPVGMQEFRQLVADLPMENDCTIFISSHQLDEVEKIATHIALLKGGRVLLQSDMPTLIAQHEGRLRLIVDNAASARDLLALHFVDQAYTFTIHDSQTLHIHRLPQDCTHAVNTCLVQANMRLHQAIFEKPNLEQWFHQFAVSNVVDRDTNAYTSSSFNNRHQNQDDKSKLHVASTHRSTS